MTAPIKRILRDKKALKWLRDHKDEFNLTGALPHRQSFPRVYLTDQKFQADLIQQGMPYANKLHQRVAELYLRMPPREIADELGLPRRQVYAAIFSIKNIAREKWLLAREALIGARETPPRCLDTHPARIAYRTVKLTLGERVAHAYLLENGYWVDESGAEFTADVQEILHHRAEDLSGAESLDVEDV